MEVEGSCLWGRSWKSLMENSMLKGGNELSMGEIEAKPQSLG